MATYRESKPGPAIKPAQRVQVADIPVSVGNVRSKDYPAVKTEGVKVRGTGAATKGLLARGMLS